MPQLRKNAFTREWVIIANERGTRPHDFRQVESSHIGHLPEVVENCPFCPDNEDRTPQEVLAYRKDGHPNGPGWWVRVVPNLYPALAIEGGLSKAGVGLYDTMNGVGAHEVIIETPYHNRALGYLDEPAIQDVIWAWRDRYVDLRRDRRFKYIMIFRNQGKIAGASLEHPHSQLIATPIVPHDVEQEVEGMERYYEFHDRCLWCDVILHELYDGSRVVLENEEFVAMVPFAARFPYELSIAPKEHQACFAQMQREEVAQFASILKGALLKTDSCLGYPAYNFSLVTAPAEMEQSGQHHWHLDLVPRLTVTAGFEMGTGMHINVTAPEQAAEQLRAADPSRVMHPVEESASEAAKST